MAHKFNLTKLFFRHSLLRFPYSFHCPLSLSLSSLFPCFISIAICINNHAYMAAGELASSWLAACFILDCILTAYANARLMKCALSCFNCIQLRGGSRACEWGGGEVSCSLPDKAATCTKLCTLCTLPNCSRWIYAAFASYQNMLCNSPTLHTLPPGFSPPHTPTLLLKHTHAVTMHTWAISTRIILIKRANTQTDIGATRVTIEKLPHPLLPACHALLASC